MSIIPDCTIYRLRLNDRQEWLLRQREEDPIHLWYLARTYFAYRDSPLTMPFAKMKKNLIENLGLDNQDQPTDLEIDHKVARALGGVTDPESKKERGSYWHFPEKIHSEIYGIAPLPHLSEFRPTVLGSVAFCYVLENIDTLKKDDDQGGYSARGRVSSPWRSGTLARAVSLAFLDTKQ